MTALPTLADFIDDLLRPITAPPRSKFYAGKLIGAIYDAGDIRLDSFRATDGKDGRVRLTWGDAKNGGEAEIS